MTSKIISSTILFLTITNFLFAQNPFESIGVKNIKVLKFSHGKFNEFFDNDSIVQIGSIIFNTKSNEIVAFVERDTMYSEATLKPEITSRWLSPDPLAAKFPMLTPYQFASLNPVRYIDLDGLEGADIKYESGHSSQMIGKDGADLDVYNQSFDDIIINTITSIATDIAVYKVGSIFYKIGNRFLNNPATRTAAENITEPTVTLIKSDTKAAQVISNAEETATKSEANVYEIGKTKSGDTRKKVIEGEKKFDITKERVKEYVPEPKAKSGSRKVDFKKEGYPKGSEPHNSGNSKKRTPTPEEIKMINENTPK